MRKIEKLIWVITFLSLTAWMKSCSQAESLAQYGEVVRYSENTAIRYPDFTLTYKGEEVRGAGGVYARGFTIYLFTVSAKSSEQQIEWSSGTGDIMETAFRVGGSTFYLDLAPRKNRKFLNSGRRDLIVHDEDGYEAYRK